FNGNDSKCYYVCKNIKCRNMRSQKSNVIICTNCTKNNNNELYVWNSNHAYKFCTKGSIKGSIERPSVVDNGNNKTNSKQFQSSKRNKKLKQILPLQKLKTVSKKCICGNTLHQMKVVDEKYCDNPVCYNYNNPIKVNKLVWHCNKGQITEHPQGFDICNHCISKNIDVSKIITYQTNNLNIDDTKDTKDKYIQQLVKDNIIDDEEAEILNEINNTHIEEEKETKHYDKIKLDEKAEETDITPTTYNNIDNVDDEYKDNYKLNEDEIDADDIITQNKQKELQHIFNKTTLQVENTSELIKCQNEDAILGNIIFYITNGSWRDETIDNVIRIQAERGEYIISKNKGILMYKSNRKNNINPNYRIVIPQKLIANLLDYYHNKYIHNGINKLQF